MNIHVKLVGLFQSKFGTAQRLTCEISDSQDIFMTEPAENIWELLVTVHVQYSNHSVRALLKMLFDLRMSRKYARAFKYIISSSSASASASA